MRFARVRSAAWLAGFEARAQEYWDWLAVALFLFTTVDMITTAYAARAVGVVHEANPLMQWSLSAGPAAFAALNLLTVVCVAALFERLLGVLERVAPPYDRYFGAVVEMWLGGLLAAGFLIFANNLAVIVYGRSLL